MEKELKTLQINLLGVPQVLLDGLPIAKKTLAKKKASAILYYLAAVQQEITREHLGVLLWGDQPQANASASVRGRAGLWHLRQHFEAYIESGNPTHLIGNFAVDVAEFEAIIAQANPSVKQLKRLAKLYRGTFLDQFSLDSDGTEEYELWLLERRERYRTFVINALLKLVVHHTDWQEFDEAFQYVEQLLEIESWSEAAHRYKMRLLAYQGERGEALKQYERCYALLADNLAIEPDLETQTLFEEIRDNRLQKPPAIPFAAPPEPPRFIGRNTLIRTIENKLEQSKKMAVVALIGMGGVGKTTLATHMAHRLRKQFKDGVLWANVSESAPSDIIESWVQFYGREVAATSDLATRKVVWNAVSARRTMLVVLDGVESAEQVRPLLPNSANSVVLLTTRNRDSAESLHAQLIDVPVFDNAESKRLLHHILADGFDQTDTPWSLAEEDSAETICNLLEHLPLAIEIIGHRLRSRRHLTLARVADQLEKLSRLDHLQFSDKGVRVSFELSWQYLSDEQRHFFALLSIFAGQPFMLQTAARVADIDPFEAASIVDELQALSLVQWVSDDYQRQHALLADFAEEKAKQLNLDMSAAEARFADAYFQFSQRHVDDPLKLRHEWGNINRATKIAHSQQNWQRVCDHTQLMVPAWEIRGRYAEAQACYALARHAAQHLNDSATEAAVLERWAFSLWEQSKGEEAHALLEACLALYEALGDEQGQSNAQVLFGRMYVSNGDYEEGHQRLTSALEMKERLGDAAGKGMVLHVLSWLNVRNKMYDSAEALTRQSIDVRTGVDEAGLADSIRYMASINIYRRDYAAALPYCEQALAKFRDLNRKPDLAMALYNLAALLTRLERFDEAMPYVQEAFELFKQMGNIKFEALCAREKALNLLRAGRPKAAIRPTLHAERLLRILDDKRNLAYVLSDLFDVCVATDDRENAQLAHTEATDLARTMRDAELMERLAQQKQRLESNKD